MSGEGNPEGRRGHLASGLRPTCPWGLGPGGVGVTQTHLSRGLGTWKGREGSHWKAIHQPGLHSDWGLDSQGDSCLLCRARDLPVCPGYRTTASSQGPGHGPMSSVASQKLP